VKYNPTIITYAGTGSLTVTTGGNGGPATAAGLNNPEGIAYDAFGNTYIADYYNNVIRVVNSAGVINAFAGTGTVCPNPTAATGACGDGGAASAATFKNPTAMQFDVAGNLYIADKGDARIRKITATNGVITGASIVSTVAGNGTAGTTGTNGVATSAELNDPHSLALDSAGDLWICNQTGDTIQFVPAANQTRVIGIVVTTNGATTTTTAGTATALTAHNLYTIVSGLEVPTGVALDTAGDLYIAELGTTLVREVNAAGALSTVAGSLTTACPVYAPTATYPGLPNCGDGGQAINATLAGPTGVFVDGAGNLIIGDATGARVREVSPAGVISTIAGDSQECTNTNQTVTNAAYPTCGDGGAATKALVSFPILVSINAAGNILYVDQYDNKIREILERSIFPATNVGATSASQNVNLLTTGAANTIITSISVPSDAAGNPEFIVGTVTGCVVGGTTGNAPGTGCTIPVTFNPAYAGTRTEPLIVVTNGGTFQFGLTGTGVAPQAILTPGVLATVAGTGTAGATGNGAAATAATLNTPRQITFDYAGNYYIGDLGNNEIREVNTAGNISVFAGGGATNYITTPGGAATGATLNQPQQVAFDFAGNMYISDYGNHVVSRVDAVTKDITVIAGTGAAGNTGDGGLATSATITGPAALAINQVNGNIYVADGNQNGNKIRLINASTGTISTYAGTGALCSSPTATCGDNGPATAAQFYRPNGIAIDGNGNIFVSDTLDNRVRRIDATTGIITTVAGTGTAAYTGDGAAATSATLNAPFQLQVDAAGDLFIADSGNNVIRMVSGSTGNISTVAGNGTVCTTVPSPACGDAGPSNVSAFSDPTGVALDVNGNVFVVENGSNRVRKVTSNPAKLTFPTEPVGTSGGNLNETLLNIGNATLTYTTPMSPNSNALVTTTGPTAAASNAFTQINSTTCGPIYSTTTTGTTLASGATCIFAVNFTPDTAAGNYTGTLVETDNSLYNTASTQTVNLAGVGTTLTPVVTLGSNPNPSYLGQNVTFTATVTSSNSSAPAPTGTVTFTYTTTAAPTTPITITGSPVTVSTTAGVTTAVISTATLPLGTDSVTATYSGDGSYVTVASTAYGQVVQQVSGAADTVKAASTTTTVGTADQLTFAIPVITGAAVPAGSVAFSAGATSLGNATWPTTPLTGTCPSGSGTCYLLSPPTAPTNIPVGSPTTVTATYTPTAVSGYAAPATAPTVGVTVMPLADTITVTSPTSPDSVLYGSGTVPISASSTSGQPITYATSTPTVCSVSTTGVVTTLSTGICTITLNQAAAGNYAAAPQQTLTINVGAGTNIITFPALSNTAIGATPPVPAATATSGVTPTYTSSTMSVCTVTSAGVITDVVPGTCTITAAQGATGNYAAATSVSQSFQVTPLADAITVASPASPYNVAYGSGTVPIAASSTSGQPITYATTTPTVCSVSTTGVVTTLSTGTCTVTLNQPAAGNYAAAPQQTVTLNVGAGANSITFPGLANTVFGAPPPVPAATATSGVTPTYTSTTTSVCTVTSAGVITDVAIGTCTITASQGATGNYAAATSVSQSFQVTPLTDNITVSSPISPDTVSYTSGGTVPITASSTSGQPLMYSTSSAACTVSSTGVITEISTGSCAVTVSQPAAGNYAAATPQMVTVNIGAGTNVITFPPLPSTPAGATAPVPAATSTAGGTITYGSTTPSVCTVSGGVITDVAPGACTITANQGPTGNYGAAAQQSQSYQVTPLADTITVPGTVPSTAIVGGTVPIGATTTSGVTPTYNSTTPTICSVSATGVVTTLAIGSCSVSVSQAAAGNYAAATSQTVTISVGGQSQTITNFGSPVTATYGGTAPVLGATATSGLTPTYSATGTACSVTSAGVVTILAAGSCQITASQAGNSTYAAATPVTETLTVNPAADAITIPPTVPGTATVGSTTPIGATTTSGLPPTYTSTTPTICSVSASGVVTSLAIGSCSVTVSQSAAGNYAAATPQTVTITMNGQSQLILNFGNPITATYGGPAPVLAAAPTSGLTPTYTATGAACSVTSAGVVTILAVGTCQITAAQAGNSTYAAAPTVGETLTVNPEADAITIPPTVPSTAIVGGTVPIGATTTSGVTPTYTSTTPTTCSVSATGVVTMLASGTCTVSVTQPAAGNFAAAPPQTVTISVGGQSQTIQNFGSPVTITYGATVPVLAATATSGLAPTYTATGTACSVTSAGAVTILAVGTCQITASQAGNSTYAASTPVTETVTVNPAADIISIPGTVPTTATVGGTVPIGATTTSGVTPTYTSTTPTICSVSTTGVVTTLASGSCSVTVSQAAAGNYSAATPQIVNISVSGQSQTIQNFGSPITTIYGSAAPVLGATATSGLVPTYAATGSACSVTSSGAVTILAVGTCQITASQAGNSTYAAATPITENLTVNPEPDVITIPPTVPTTAMVGSTTPIGATTTSGLPPTYTSTTPLVCSVSSTGVITTLAAGTCTVSVTQPAAGNFATATPQIVTLNVSTQSQTIQNFGTPISVAYGGTAPVLGATSTSGLIPTYSATGTACSVTSAGAVTILAVGTCQITASQAGNSTYSAATPVTETLTVNPTPDVITIPPTVPSTTPVGTNISIGATTTSGLPPTYTSTTPAVCVVSTAGVITTLTSGTCSITVTQPATGNYAAATPQTVNLSVSGGTNTITFPPLPNTPFTSVPPVPAATATSGQPVTYSTSTATCSVTATGVVTFNSIGTCSITANQAATGGYAAANPVTQSFLITPGVDVIAVPPTVPSSSAPGATFPIGATSTSGGPVTYVSTTPTVCTVTSPGGIVTILTTGACTITASQPASGNYAAAPPQTITLNAYDFAIAANAPVSQTVEPGSTVVYTYALVPLGGQYPGSNVTYTVTGLPTGATYTLTPTSGSVTRTAGPQALTLTITTAHALAMNHLRQTVPWTLALLLPFFLRRKLRRRLAQSLMLLLMAGAAFTLTGCAAPNGFFGQPIANYSITVTATSGNITHSAVPVTLQVQ
jgi:hypothetical protein